MEIGEQGPQAVGSGRALRAAMAGLAGVATVTALNEVGRRSMRGAPRAEKLGVRSVRAIARRAGHPLGRKEAFRWALAGEALSNGAYFALAGLYPSPLTAGALLGALAGGAAVLLPPRLGLGVRPTRRSGRTAAMAFGWYLAAGLAAGAVAWRLRPRGPGWSF